MLGIRFSFCDGRDKHKFDLFPMSFFATVQTFERDKKLPLVLFKIFFLLALEATEFTERGIIHFFCECLALVFTLIFRAKTFG